MRKGVVFLLLLAGSAAGAVAQQKSPTIPMASRGAVGQLNAQQTVGLRLFNQSCQVCHTQALLDVALWGPPLGQDSLGGDPKAIHDKIANGGALMPGFKYKWSDVEIDAIVAYVGTMAKTAGQPAPKQLGAPNAAAARGAD